jgi:hypothetical protein
MDLTHLQQVSSSPRSLAAVVTAKRGVVECLPNIQEGTQRNLVVTQGLFQSMYNLEECCFCRHTCTVGKLVLVKWFSSQDTIPDVCQVISEVP